MSIKIKDKGFTLLELLIVIAIIGILSALLMVNFVGIKQRARDGQRKSNLRQIQSALELYRADQGSYIDQLQSCGANLQSVSGTIYMRKIPCDPLDGTTSYSYWTDTRKYCLRACLENASDKDADQQSANYNQNNPNPIGCALSVCPQNTYSYTLLNP